MTRLVASMDETQGYIPNTDAAAGFYLLDSEIIRVSPETHPTGGRRVDRALGETSAVPHRIGATLHAVEDPEADEGGAVTPGPWEDPATTTPESHANWHITKGDMEGPP